VDALVFLPDPMNPHPHEADFQALIRVALMADIPFALSPASADHLARGMSAAEDEGGTAAAHGGAA
jgi:methylglyoxal synthase